MIRVAAGEMDALGVLFERYKQPLFGFLYRLVHDVACAEDLALEVFLRVYDRRATYKPGFKFSTWLYAIAHHLATDHLRRVGRRELPALHDLDDTPGPGEGPVEAAARGEMAVRVRAAVAALPEDQRVVILLREYQGFSYREIAEVLQISEEAVRVRVFRARQVLRKALAPFCEENIADAVTFSR